MHRNFLPSPDRDVVQRTLAFEPGKRSILNLESLLALWAVENGSDHPPS